MDKEEKQVADEYNLKKHELTIINAELTMAKTWMYNRKRTFKSDLKWHKNRPKLTNDTSKCYYKYL